MFPRGFWCCYKPFIILLPFEQDNGIACSEMLSGLSRVRCSSQHRIRPYVFEMRNKEIHFCLFLLSQQCNNFMEMSFLHLLCGKRVPFYTFSLASRHCGKLSLFSIISCRNRTETRSEFKTELKRLLMGKEIKARKGLHLEWCVWLAGVHTLWAISSPKCIWCILL